MSSFCRKCFHCLPRQFGATREEIIVVNKRTYGDWCRMWIRIYIHKRHNISRPYGRAMECLLWEYFQKIDRVITAPHCMLHWVAAFLFGCWKRDILPNDSSTRRSVRDGAPKGPFPDFYPSSWVWMTYQILSETGIWGFLPLNRLYNSNWPWPLFFITRVNFLKRLMSYVLFKDTPLTRLHIMAGSLQPAPYRKGTFPF